MSGLCFSHTLSASQLGTIYLDAGKHGFHVGHQIHSGRMEEDKIKGTESGMSSGVDKPKVDGFSKIKCSGKPDLK